MARDQNLEVVDLRYYRKLRLLSQCELAAKAGVHVQTIKRIENGSPAGPKTIRSLAVALEVESRALVSPAFRNAGAALNVTQDSINELGRLFHWLTQAAKEINETLLQVRELTRNNVRPVGKDAGRRRFRKVERKVGRSVKSGK